MKLYYAKDAGQFYLDTNRPKFFNETVAVKVLMRIDPKYENKALAYAKLEDIKQIPFTAEELREMHKPKKAAGVDFKSIYEDFRQILPIYSFIRPNGSRSLYLVNEDRECTPIEYVDLDSLTDALMAHDKVWLAAQSFHESCEALVEHQNKFPFITFLKLMITTYMLPDIRLKLKEEPKRFSWEPDDFAFKKFDMGTVSAGPLPTWNEFLGRLDYPEVFCAWVWSLFEPTNNVRQIMWLTGGGNDGKSSVQKAIERMFGEQHVMSMTAESANDKWAANSAYGKSLITIADCHNPHLLRNNFVKQLTGGDTTSIEGKGVNAFRGKLYAKLFVTSNPKPVINPESAAETSRLITLAVTALPDAKKDAGFEDRLVSEQSAFLHKCQIEFAKIISKGNNKLELPAGLIDKMLAECASEMFYVLQDFVERHIEFGPNFYCESRKLGPKLKEFTSTEHWMPTDKVKYFMSDFSAKMNFQGITLQRLTVDNKTTTAYIGFKIKGDDAGSLKLVQSGELA